MTYIIKGLKGIVVEVIDGNTNLGIERSPEADADPFFLDTFVDLTGKVRVGDTYSTKSVGVEQIPDSVFKSLISLQNEIRKLKGELELTPEEFKEQLSRAIVSKE